VARTRAHKDEGWQARQTYPYSVIPGGVHSVSELREMAARDYIVARHYAGFNYERAHLVRTSARRAVYMSYRMRNRIFWTHKKVHLPPGELLLSDGNIEARVRCGNQVSGDPKVEISNEEPTEDVLDHPVAELVPDSGMPFRSALARPTLPGTDVQPPHGPQLFANNFFFPYVPIGAAPGLRVAQVAQAAVAHAQRAVHEKFEGRARLRSNVSDLRQRQFARQHHLRKAHILEETHFGQGADVGQRIPRTRERLEAVVAEMRQRRHIAVGYVIVPVRDHDLA